MATTILVLESCPKESSYFANYLESDKFQLVRTSDASDIVTSIEKVKPDTLIVDLDYLASPLAIKGQIKSLFPELTLLVIASNDNMQSITQALREGADEYQVKPLRNQDLFEHTLTMAMQRTRLEVENRLYRKNLEKTNHELTLRLEQLKADQLAAQEVQMRMLPEPFVMKRLQFDHRVQPSLLLSGDFFDYFELGPQLFGFYLADVSGHGASSAFVTTLLKNLTYRLRRNYIRGSSDDIVNPASVLKRFNTELMESQLDKHLTMVFGLIDIQDKILHYSIGGHHPMPILLEEGKAQYIEGRGMPVGLFPKPTYNNYQMPLPDHFTMMLLSDGILEVLPQTSLEEKEAYLLALAEESNGNLNTFWTLAGIDQKDEIPDDVALVTISRE